MRRWFDRRSFARAGTISGRLILYLALAVVLTAVAVSVVTFVLGSREARDRVVGQLKSVVALKQQEIATWQNNIDLNLDIVLSSQSILADLRTLTQQDGSVDAATRQAAYRRVQQLFFWAAQRMSLFDEVFFMDRQGNVLVSTSISHEGQRQNLNDYFVQGLRGSYIEQPSYSLSLGEMTITASEPAKEAGEVLGVLAGRANLQGLNQIMIERPGLGQTGETYLVGSNYRLLTYLRQPGYMIPDTYVRTAGTQAALNRQTTGSGTYESYSGDNVIGVYGWVPGLHVALLAEQQESEALGPTRRVLWIIVGVAAIAAIVAILAGFGLTRRITRPLAQLSTTAGLIADGDIDLRATVVRDDEIGTLAHSFNRMTGQLGLLVTNLQRRTERLKAIDETGRQISSILELDELLPYVAKSILETFGYEMVRVFMLTDSCSGRLVTCARQTCGPPLEVNLAETIDLDKQGLWEPGGSEKPVPADGVTAHAADDPGTGTAAAGAGAAPAPDGADAPADAADPGADLRFIAAVARTEQPAIPAEGGLELAVPIKMGDRMAGVLDIVASENRPLDEEDALAARTLADQLAIAIENSRLYEQASELAASHERQRLARDLHDAVSQTLFSVSLIAEVLPRIYARDPEQGAQRLEELRQLTRGALAEMRTLLLELRPAALAEANLSDLLKQLGEAVTGRARIPVEVVVEFSGELPTDVRLAFYRIAQEALNNVAKHSGAAKAKVTLTPLAEHPGGARLTVEDDGTGFDPAGAGGGQLGLGIMRERAEAVRAHILVCSAPSEGTTVAVTWSPASADQGL
jgi:signal transduction histidine kinase/HAMP domain-containing protein